MLTVCVRCESVGRLDMRVRLVGALAAGVQAHMVMGRNGSGRLDVKGVRREERTLSLQPYRPICHRAFELSDAGLRRVGTTLVNNTMLCHMLDFYPTPGNHRASFRTHHVTHESQRRKLPDINLRAVAV